MAANANPKQCGVTAFGRALGSPPGIDDILDVTDLGEWARAP